MGQSMLIMNLTDDRGGVQTYRRIQVSSAQVFVIKTDELYVLYRNNLLQPCLLLHLCSISVSSSHSFPF